MTSQPSIPPGELREAWLLRRDVGAPLPAKAGAAGLDVPREGQMVFAAPPSPGTGLWCQTRSEFQLLLLGVHPESRGWLGSPWALCPSGASPLAAPWIPEQQLFCLFLPFFPFFPQPQFGFIYLEAESCLQTEEFLVSVHYGEAASPLQAGMQLPSDSASSHLQQEKELPGATGDLLDPPADPGDERGTQILSSSALLRYMPLTNQHLLCLSFL